MTGQTVTIAVSLLLLAPLVAGWLSLLITGSRWLHVTNLISIGTLVGAEVAITERFAKGSVTAFGEMVYIDALSSVILFIIGTWSGLFAVYAFLYGREVARGVIAPKRLNLFLPVSYVPTGHGPGHRRQQLGRAMGGDRSHDLGDDVSHRLWRRRESLEAGWKYLILCSVGISLALFGVVLMYYSSLRARRCDSPSISLNSSR